MSIALPTRQALSLLTLSRLDPEGSHADWLESITSDDEDVADGYHLDPLQLLMRAEDVDLHLEDDPC